MAKQSLSQIFGNGTQGLSKNKQTLSQTFNFSPTEPRKEETIDYNNGGFLGGVGYVGGRIGLGALGILEGIWDYTAGGIAKIFGADEWAEQQFADNFTGDLTNDLNEWYNPSKGWQVAGDVAGGIGNSLVGMAVVAGASLISGGTLTAPVAGLISGATIGLGAAGQSTAEAYQKTGELGGKEFLYGALSGITEGALEGVTGAAGKVGAKLFAKQTAKTVAKKSIVKGLLSNFAGEAFEEGMSEILDPYFQRWTQVDPDAKNATAQEVGYAALIGGLSGVIMGGFGEAVTTVRQIKLGNSIAQNITAVNETLDYAKSFADYEQQHATGREVYTEISDLVTRYQAADKGDGTISVAQKKMLGQMSVDIAALVHDEGIQRSKQNIVANADELVNAINARGYKDADGNVIHFANAQEFVNNDAIVTRFATMDYLGHLLMSKDSVYDAISNKRAGEIMQADFRNFQKEATPQQKKSINDLFGIDVDSITYDDFVDKIQTTNSEVLTSKKAELSAMSAAKKEISRVLNTGEAVSDASAITEKTAFKDGVSVFKVNEKTYAGVSKTADGKYMLYLDGNISHALTKTELVNAIKALTTPQSAATDVQTNVGQPQQATQAAAPTVKNTEGQSSVVQNTEVAKENAVQNKKKTAKQVEETKPKKKKAVEKTAETIEKSTEKATEIKKTEKHTLEQSEKGGETVKRAETTTSKQQEINKLKESPVATERVMGELYDLGVVDYDKVINTPDGQNIDAVAEYAMGDLSDYERQGLYSAKSLAKAISEHADEIRAGKKPYVEIMDRAIELDGKEMPKWYKEQYHSQNAESTERAAAKSTQKGETSGKKPTAKKRPKLDKARERLVSLTLSKDVRENLQGAYIMDGVQYVSDGTFCAAYTDAISGLTEAKGGIDFGKILDKYRNSTDMREVIIDADAIRAVVPAKKTELSISKIGDTYYNTKLVSRVIDTIDSPQTFLTEHKQTKDGFNIDVLYIKGKNGDACIMPMNGVRIKNDSVKIDYTASFADGTQTAAQTEQVAKSIKQPKAKKQAETASKTETTDKITNTELKKGFADGKGYKEFTVKEFQSLPKDIQAYFKSKEAYSKSKRGNGKSIVLIQSGEFYTALFDDAKTVSDALSLTLTGKNSQAYSERIQTTAFSVAQFDEMQSKLAAAGYDVIKTSVDNQGAGTLYQAKTDDSTAKEVAATDATAKAEKAEKTTKKQADFGEKIGGARKDEWAARGLTSADMEGMNAREIQKYAKKERVWKRPNWEQAVADGGDRGLLYAQNEIYKSLNATPSSAFSYRNKSEADILAAAKLYADEITEIRKMAENAKTAEDFKNMGAKWITEKGYAEIKNGRLTWTEKYYRSPALYGSNYLVAVDKMAQRFNVLGERALMEGFGVSSDSKLPRGYEIRKTADSFYGSKAETGNYYIVKSGYRVAVGFNTIEEAIAYGKEHFGSATTAAKAGKQRYVPEQLSEVHREGLDYRQGKDIAGDDYIRDFGIKGGEFGNWLSELDRKTSLNYGYDAFCDLADALGMEKTDISLNGTLNIGFGSRGQGLTGAAAHYEPLRKVINLTKMNGAGSLAHEWWHAFEDYISGDTNQSEMSSNFSKLPKNTRAAATELVNTMLYRDGTVEENALASQKQADRYQQRLKYYLDNNFAALNGKMSKETMQNYVNQKYYKRMATEADFKRFAELTEQARKGDAQAVAKFYDNKRSVVDDLSDLKKEITGKGLAKEDRLALAHVVQDAGLTPDVKVKEKTEYYKDALKISATHSKDGGYWESNCEMLARAFASYITDKTAKSNDYLSGHSEGAVLADGTVAYIMPRGEERTRINAAFDKLFAAAKEDGLIHENTSEKPKNKSRYALSEQAELNSQPAGNKSQTLKPLEMKRAEIYARNNVKGYENLSYGEKLEVEWTIASGWRYGVDNVKIKQMAQIAADTGTGIGFANISAKSSDGKAKAVDGVCYSRSGHNTIYLSPDSVNSVEKITLEELAHAFEGTEGYSDIAKMATEYYDARPAEKAKIENVYKELYKNEEALFAEEILPSELTAHYVREMLGNRNMLAKLTAEKPTFIQRCLNWLKGFKKKAAAVDTTVAADIQILENRFKTLYNQNKGKVANGIANTSRMSIASVDGKDTVIVDTDQHIFDGVQREELGNVARKYIQERFRGKTIDGTTYSRISEKEYTHSKDTQRLFNQSGSEYSAKMRASTELTNLVKTGELIGHESAKHTKPVNAGGFNRYNVSFILDGKTFKGELLIAQGSDNVATFYDIVKIKESNSTSNNTQVAGRSNALSNNSISKNGEKVNKKYALSSKMDSEGRILSAEQQRYFADSKVTDNDGNLLVVYHGTNNDFYTFDSGRVGKGIDQFGSGYYFTTNKDHAGAYGNRTIEGYLNLKNPFIIEVGDNGGSIDQFYRQPVTQSQAEKILKMHPDIYSTEDSPLGNFSERYWTEGATESVIKEVAAQMDEIGMLADNTMFGYYPNELNAAIKKVLGYDGIQVNYGKYEKYYIAWEQNQIKDVTNTSPTTAADIRYALSEEQQTKLDSTKGADKVMTELPNSRVSVKDVITKETTKEQFAEQVKSDTKQYKEGFQIAMTNAQAGVERVMREAGVQDATAVTNYVRAGKNAGMNALDIEGAQFSLDGETRLGESWGKIWQPIYALDKKDGQAYAKFQEYLLHYHNIDRMAVGKPVFGENVTAADSRAAIAQIESVYPQFKKIAEKVWKFNDNNLQLSVDSGMYSQEYADHLRELYPHYVPTLREEHAGGIATIQGKNNIRVNNAKKQAIGADTRILPIDDTVAQQTLQKYASARTNKLLVDVLNGKAHDEFRVVSSEDASIDVDTDTLVKTFEDKAKHTHQITFYHDGKRVTVETSRNFYKGIEAFQPSGDSAFNNAILNGAAKINSTFKKLVTAYNPFFSFFRNPIRDIQDAGLYTRYPLRQFTAAYMEARKQIATNGVYWQEAKAAGITSASVFDYEKGLNYKNMSALQKASQRIEAASNSIEMSPRLAEYICSREAGFSVQESLLRAQDVTTNFGRGGIFAKKLNATIMPFLNPAIQGFSKMVRAYTGKDAAQSWVNLIVRSIMLGIGASALNDLLHDDDEDYNNLSDYVKENNYVLSFGDGNFLKVPKGRVESVFGGAYLRSKWYMQGKEDAWEGYLSSIASAVTPVDNFTRTIFSPITDIKTNTTWYGGEIEGQKFANTKPSERYDESTSNIAIWLGKVFNYSPKKIHYLLDQYGGVVTDILLPATTVQAESGIVSKNLLANSTTNSRWSTEFYSQIEKYTYKKTDGDAKAKATVKYLNSIKSTISDMYTQKRQIQTDKSLSNSEKLNQTQIIQAAINALMKDSLTNAKYLYEELGKYDLSDDKFDMSYLDAISTVVGAEYALKSYNKTVYEKATNLNKLGVSYDTYYDYYFATKSIEADVTSSGKTVSGSRKQKLIQYTMSTDLPIVQKLMLIMSSGYSISDGDISGVSAKQVKRVVAQYIAKSGLSSEEKTALAKMCGLTVRNGRVYLA